MQTFPLKTFCGFCLEIHLNYRFFSIWKVTKCLNTMNNDTVELHCVQAGPVVQWEASLATWHRCFHFQQIQIGEKHTLLCLFVFSLQWSVFRLFRWGFSLRCVPMEPFQRKRILFLLKNNIFEFYSTLNFVCKIME